MHPLRNTTLTMSLPTQCLLHISNGSQVIVDADEEVSPAWGRLEDSPPHSFPLWYASRH
jgi:hypothetical protein